LRCTCPESGYLADDILGITGATSRRLDEKLCLLTSDKAFARSGEILDGLLGVKLASETVRLVSERHAARMTAWQKSESASKTTFARAEGEFELAIDAGKVNTLETGWRDLKIAVAQIRPLAETATPEQWQTRELPAATARVMWADIAMASTFRRHWAPRLKRLGLKSAANLHVIGDGATWIWKSAQLALTGCRQTLDVYHAFEHIADAGKKLFGEATPKMATFFERGRELLVSEGWQGICRLVGEQYQREVTPSERLVLEDMTRYFMANLKRLDYAANLKEGRAIGSGVVEGAAKTLGLRLKARGARWKLKNARNMASMVCLRQGPEWAAYWDAVA
jgi:hypothetical protein